LNSNRNNNADPQNSSTYRCTRQATSQLAANSLIGNCLAIMNQLLGHFSSATTCCSRSYANFNGVITEASAFSSGFVGVRRATSTATLGLPQ
jgi:hypothetical protein